jgi:hypothetical protein
MQAPVVHDVLTMAIFGRETITAMEFVMRSGTRAPVVIAIVIMTARRPVAIMTICVAAAAIVIIRESRAPLCRQHGGDQRGNDELAFHMRSFHSMRYNV